MLRSFESIKRIIKNDICDNEMITFNECDRDSDDIKNVYKVFKVQNFKIRKKCNDSFFNNFILEIVNTSI